MDEFLMTDYHQNSLLKKKTGEDKTFGLPLFENEHPTGGPQHYRLESAPVSVALATDTRKLSHITLTFDKKRLAEMQQVVYDVIKEHGPVTNEEINKILDWKAINRVVGRTFELRHFGKNKKALVIPDIKRPCTVTGNMATPWKVNEEISAEDLNEKV
jgi:hypothetical protein